MATEYHDAWQMQPAEKVQGASPIGSFQACCAGRARTYLLTPETFSSDHLAIGPLRRNQLDGMKDAKTSQLKVVGIW
jgi:hypothetical protein